MRVDDCETVTGTATAPASSCASLHMRKKSLRVSACGQQPSVQTQGRVIQGHAQLAADCKDMATWQTYRTAKHAGTFKWRDLQVSLTTRYAERL